MAASAVTLASASAEGDCLRSTQAARRLVQASRVLAGETKYKSLDRWREGTERHLEPSGAGHDTPDRHERRHTLARVVNPVRQAAWAVRSNRHLIPMTDC